MITSLANPHVKMMRSLTRRKTRRIERAFLVEGHRLLDDAFDAGVIVRSVIVREDVGAVRLDRLMQRSANNVHIVATSIFDKSSNVEHSQGVAAVCSMPDFVSPDDVKPEDVLILDKLRDPGNMGTVLRSAAAAGISTVLVTPSSVDAFSPKAIRAGMGAHFRLNFGQFDDTWRTALQESGVPVVFAATYGELDYVDFDWTSPFALIVGGETEALSDSLPRLVTDTVRIPMAADVESLNAAVAGSILLFEAARHRRFRDNLG